MHLSGRGVPAAGRNVPSRPTSRSADVLRDLTRVWNGPGYRLGRAGRAPPRGPDPGRRARRRPGWGRARLSEEAVAAMAATRAHVEALAASAEPAYGISTGFGGLATTSGSRRSSGPVSSGRSSPPTPPGMGDPVEPEVVRAMVLLRVRTLASGRTGARPELAQSSAGPARRRAAARGPRVRLARLQRRPGTPRPCRHRSRPHPRGEGGAGADQRHRRHARHARAGVRRPGRAAAGGGRGRGHERGGPARHRPRRSPPTSSPCGPIPASRRRPPTSRPCSRARPSWPRTAPTTPACRTPTRCRCAPQVHGAARDALAFAEACADRELAAAIDNPVVLADGRVESVGNFHGAPLAHACDLLAIVVADVAAMSERRTDRFLDATRSHGCRPSWRTSRASTAA